MLSLFRTNQDIINVVLLLLVFLLRLPYFLLNAEWPEGASGILGFWMYERFEAGGVWLFLLDGIIIFLTAFLINDLVSQHKLAKSFTMFPGYFYVLLCSIIPVFIGTVPEHLANFFLILGLRSVLSTYRKSNCADQIFNIGFFIGLASLFYFSYGVFILLSIFGLNLMRALDIREILMVIGGFVVPYLLLMGYLYWYDNLYLMWELQWNNNFGFTAIKGLSINLLGQITLSFFGILLGLFVLNYNRLVLGKKMQDQKKIALFYWVAFLSLGTLLIQSNPGLDHLLILTIPLSYYLAIAFLRLDNRIGEVLNLLLIVGLFFLQYQDIYL